MNNISLRLRIILSFCVILFFCLIAILFLLKDTRDQVRIGAAYIQAQEVAQGFTADTPSDHLPTHFANSPLSYSLYDPTGQLLWFSGALQRPLKLRAYTPKSWLQSFRFNWNKPRGKIINLPVSLEGGYTLMVAKEDSLERAVLDTLLHAQLLRSLIILVPFLLLALLLVVVLLHWSLRPVRKVSLLAQHINPLSPDYRLPVRSLPTELRPLATAANFGLKQLSHAYTKEQRFVADAAHELRTPLTVLDLRLQKYQRNNCIDWPTLRHEFNRVQRLIEQLLCLTRQEQFSAQQLHQQSRTHLTKVIRQCLATLLPLCEQHGRTICADLEENLYVTGQADLLQDAVRNILDNALLHGKGKIQLSLHHAGKAAILHIQDEGQGIPINQQHQYFQRFYKGHDKGGSGLGLAIAKKTLENAGGKLSFIQQHPCIVQLHFLIDTTQ